MPLFALILLSLFAALAAAQDTSAKGKAIGQMRRVAAAIKQCPEVVKYQDECATYYVGPTANVEWDVVDSKTVRSPYEGILEFSVLDRQKAADTSRQPKKVQEKCLFLSAAFAKAAANAKKGHYRYEFDLGTDTPEVVKMSWIVDETKESSPENPTSHSCWVDAAKSVGATQGTQK